MVKPSRLTEALFGISSDIVIYLEITCRFLEKKRNDVDAFRDVRALLL
ncbi:hypothetical protein Asulf_01343 [Archaeoglobus sulfaticallidus PM70-1]|uniref:Uncharacterized protein n=1 Tax=Archaeoglobus sulfaticallidus PM70-1 TaxID=387631 RepID=N0BCJ4_9EURY|nr:hypothetical protein [Archaeoglobus sulfaticallidus]AGK61334.1 hypothetical protein Asulf_01343 [Archaeoglobus sulfaticallidus PM70-1]